MKLRATDGKMRQTDVADTEQPFKSARTQLESQLGCSVVTSLNEKDYFNSLEKEVQRQKGNGEIVEQKEE